MKTASSLLTFGDRFAISADIALAATDDTQRYARELIGSAYAIADLIRSRHAGGEGAGSAGLTSDAAQGMQLILSLAESVLCIEEAQEPTP